MSEMKQRYSLNNDLRVLVDIPHATELLRSGNIESMSSGGSSDTMAHQVGMDEEVFNEDAFRENAFDFGDDAITLFDDQLDFMVACDQELNYDNFALYTTLVYEEVDELKDAMHILNGEASDHETNMDSITSAVDALIDIMYVAAGALNCLGIDPQKFWDEVQRSNLAKIDPETRKVAKREDGKVLKPEGWTPPNLRKIVEENWAVISERMKR